MGIGEKYKLDEEGVWVVYGEGEGGMWDRAPKLGYVRGRYDECLEYARTLPNWHSYGSGGHLEKIEIIDVDNPTLRNRISLRKHKEKLEAKLASINEQLEE